jgi:large subunit ribosomal protein L30
MSRLCVIRISGMVRMRREAMDTLDMMKLRRKYSCIVLEPTKPNLGMINKVKDFVTFGEISDDVYKLLVEKRGEKGKTFFRLHPPIKGWERKGTKMSYNNGGALGDRGEKINELVKRMI